MELTQSGKLLLQHVTASFDNIDGAIKKVQSEPDRALIRVSVEPSFASEWLNPKLHRFLRDHPDADLSVEADLRLVEFRPHEPSLAVRFGATAMSWPRTQSLHLFDLSLTPGLAPELLVSGPPVTEPTDLLRHTLLHDYDRSQWALWLAAAGVSELDAQRGTIFADAGHGMQAARLGHGVVLVDPIIDEDDLALGRFVRPFDINVPNGAYWLVARDFQALSQLEQVFVDWILSEMAAAKERVGRASRVPTFASVTPP